MTDTVISSAGQFKIRTPLSLSRANASISSEGSIPAHSTRQFCAANWDWM